MTFLQHRAGGKSTVAAGVGTGTEAYPKRAGGGMEPPKDKGNAAYWSFYFLGTGVLSPWNAFITAADYFGTVYPGGHMDRKFSVTYLPTMLITLLVVLAVGGKFPPQIRMTIGLAGFTLILLIVPIVDVLLVEGGKAPALAQAITLSGVAILGILDGIAQGAVLGEAAYLPEIYQQAYTSGTAASGVLISFLRILTRATLTGSVKDLRISTAIYFVSSASICAICLALQTLVIPSLPIVQYYKSRAKVEKQEEHIQMAEKEHDNMGLLSQSEKAGAVKAVAMRISQPIFSLVVIYFVTLTIFPGVPAEDVHSEVLGDWYAILLIAVFNIADLLGKSAPALTPVITSGPGLCWATVSRLLFFPLFLLTLKFFPSPIIFFILTMALGLTNGYVTVSAFILGAKCLSGDENHTGGNILILALVTGLVTGAVGGWGLLALE